MVAALLVALVASCCRLMPYGWTALAAGAAIMGTFCDSLLGATWQRRGWLSNSGVNLISTMVAARLALAFLK